MPRLETLCLDGDSVVDPCFKMLLDNRLKWGPQLPAAGQSNHHEPRQDGQSDVSPTIFLPHLQNLTVRSLPGPHIVMLVTARKDLGYPISHLSFDSELHTTLTQECVARMQRVVKNVSMRPTAGLF